MGRQEAAALVVYVRQYPQAFLPPNMRRHQRSCDGEKRRAGELHQRISPRRKVVKVNRDSYGRREDCRKERAVGRNRAAVRLYDSIELYDYLTRHLARSLSKQ